MADFLTLTDLRNLIGQVKIDQYFDDDADGVVQDSDQNVQDVLDAAEAEAYSYMLRAYKSRDAIADLASADPIFKRHVLFVAAEFASERRVEFTQADGGGAFMVQYDRATKYFQNLSKGLVRSRGEEVAGRGANTGGKIQPRQQIDEGKPFFIAPSKKNPIGPGGF